MENKCNNYLSESEEREAFVIYNDGIHAEETLAEGCYKEQEAIELRKLVRKGQAACEMLIANNQGLVKSIARIYLNHGVDMDDLMQEGNMGLLTAIKKFDISMGNKFSTYATYWIKQAITRAVQKQGKHIRIPSYLLDIMRNIRNVTNQLERELCRTPSFEEISLATGISVSKLVEYDSYNYSMASLDEVVGEETSLKELVSDQKTINPLDEAVTNDKKDQLMALINQLSPKARTIMIMYYGLNGNEPVTLDEIGKTFNLTRERIRQIKCSAIRELQNKIKESSVSDFI